MQTDSEPLPVGSAAPPRSAIESARDLLLAGRLSRAELTRTCLDRIAALDGQIRAWAHVDASGALAVAERLDGGDRREFPAEGGFNLLSGIPIGVKDIIDVAGMPTRAGSPLGSNAIAPRDAPVVAALRRAGAIILGKTVTCEWACFDPSPTRNPWNFAHTPGGSSSGSAAAVAAGMCLGAIGTQTGGSILRPAAYCGVVGIKPTFTPTGREGIVPVSPYLDHVGTFARGVRDALLILTAAGLADHGVAAAANRLEPAGPLRLGLLDGMFADGCSAEMAALFDRALQRIRAAGAEIVRLKTPPELELVIKNHRAIMARGAAQTHRAAFAARPDAFGPNMAGLIREGLAISNADYEAALGHQQSWAIAIDRFFAAAAVDALLTPATPATAPASLATTGDPRFNVPWSYAGTPAIALPCGLDSHGLPAGLQVVGPRGGDALLATLVAGRLEESLAFRERPSAAG